MSQTDPAAADAAAVESEQPESEQTAQQARSRRGETMITVAMWLMLAAFTVLAIGGPLFGRGVFLATEIMGDFAPWQSYLEDAETAPNRFVGDTIDSKGSQSIRIVEDTAAGAVPQWSPYSLGGFELGGLPNSGVYSPLSVPWWVAPFEYAPGLVKLLEIAAITLGMSLFLRRLGLPQATWPMASLIYASSGFIIAWTNWSQTRVAAFIPLLFWAIDRAVTRGKPVDAVPVGLVLAAMVLGGFPAVTFYGCYAAGAWGLYRVVQVHRADLARIVGSLLVCGAGVVLGVLLSAWQLAPFVQNAISVLDLESRNYAGVHLPFQWVASMFFPEIAGGIQIGILSLIPVAGLSFVGMVALILVAILPLARAVFPHQVGHTFFFGAGIALLIPAIYYGGPALNLLQLLPTMDTSHISRTRVLVGMFVAVLAAYGFALLLRGGSAFVLRNPGPNRAWAIVLRALASLGVLAAAAVVSLQAWELVPANLTYLLVNEVLTMTAIAGATAVVAVLIMAGLPPVFRYAAVAVIIAGLLLPAVSLARLWWAPSAETTFYPETDTHAFLAEHLDDQRYAVVGSTLLPGTNQVYQLRSFGGRGFVTAEWRRLLEVVDPEYFITPTYARLSGAVAPTTGDQPIMDRFGVRYVVQPPNQRAYGAASTPFGAQAAVTTLGPDQSIESAVGSGPLRGISYAIDGEPPLTGVRSTVEIVDLQGQVLSTTTTWQRSAGQQVHVAVAGEDLAADQRWRVRLTVQADLGPVPVATTADGTLWAAVVAPVDDGLVVVSAGDATIYERSSALDRVRWAGQAVLASDPAERLALLDSGRVPDDAVVLERPADYREPVPGPSPEVVVLPSDELNVQTFGVSTQTPGWVIVSDALRRPGWTATVDGEPAQIVPAEHAAGAVYVAAGSEEVELRFQTPWRTEGILVSAATGVLLILVLVGRAIRQRRG